MKKRGVLEVQMHWVFVIIAGAIILAFFIGLVTRQRAVARKELIFDISNDLNLIISGARVTEGSITEIEIPNIEINFGCQDYWIEGQKKSLAGKPIFASDKIIGNNILLWTLAWNMPFKVDNFVYATSPQVRFVFLDPPDALYKKIPDKINKEKVSKFDDLQDKGNYKIKFILFNKNPLQLAFPGWIKEYDAVAVSVYEDKIEYYNFKNKWEKKGTSVYLGEESLLGAFFTDNVDDYNCIMDKAVRELNTVAKIYAERTRLLDKSNVCPLFYGDANIELLNSLAEETSGELKFSTGKIRIDAIKGSATSLRTLNRDIEFQSCPVIY